MNPFDDASQQQHSADGNPFGRTTEDVPRSDSRQNSLNGARKDAWESETNSPNFQTDNLTGNESGYGGDHQASPGKFAARSSFDGNAGDKGGNSGWGSRRSLGVQSIGEQDESNVTNESTDALLQKDVQLLQDLGLEWQDNESATHCWCCNKAFHLVVRRKHHCRMCGHVVCWECSSQKMVVPGFETKQRVCKKCSSSWIEKLVVARQDVQQLKGELEEAQSKIGELNYQKSHLQAKNAELLSNIDDLKAEVEKQQSATEELHGQLAEKTMLIMKLKKEKAAAAAAAASKKDKKNKKRSKDQARLDSDMQPPLVDVTSDDMLAETYGSGPDNSAAAAGDNADEGDGEVRRAPEKSATMDEACKCVIS